jgi:hypothetical protein
MTDRGTAAATMTPATVTAATVTATTATAALRIDGRGARQESQAKQRWHNIPKHETPLSRVRYERLKDEPPIFYGCATRFSSE